MSQWESEGEGEGEEEGEREYVYNLLEPLDTATYIITDDFFVHFRQLSFSSRLVGG